MGVGDSFQAVSKTLAFVHVWFLRWATVTCSTWFEFCTLIKNKECRKTNVYMMETVAFFMTMCLQTKYNDKSETTWFIPLVLMTLE